MKKTKLILLIGVLIVLMFVSTASAETWTFDSGFNGWIWGCTYCTPPAFWGSTYAGASGVIVLDACNSQYQETSESVNFPSIPSKIRVHVLKSGQGFDGGFKLLIDGAELGREYIGSGYDNYLEYLVPESFQGGDYRIHILSISSSGFPESGSNSHCEAEEIGIDEVQVFPVSAVPEFPSAVLPATMIIGFLGAVLLIQRTREQ